MNKDAQSEESYLIIMSNVKEYIRKQVYNLFSTINIYIHKKQRVFIYGGSHLEDNSEAMLRYLANNYDMQIVCIAEKKIQDVSVYKNVEFKGNTYLNAIRFCLTSKVILDSSLHTIKMKPAKGQLIVQMWHGSPLKHLPENTFMKIGDFYSCLFYASDLFKKEMMNSFSIEEEKMYLSGGPRNDYLFEDVVLPECLKNIGKVVMWLPTFRHGIGLNESSKDIPILTKDNVYELETYLEERDILLLVKAHPLQMNSFEEIIPEGKGTIRLITDDDLRRQSITLYELLGQTDALLTDYSSVYFDYLLLDRPIGFTVEDMEEYASNRGFALQPPQEYMPGPKIQTMKELELFFDNLAKGNDEYADDRKRVNFLANYFTNNGNRERCARLILDAMEH